MPKLYVRIKGGNILRRDEQTLSLTPTRSGFLTVRFVEGNDPNQAAASAVQSVMNKLYKEGVVLNAADDPPSGEVEEITEVAEFPTTVRGELGLIWFPEVEA
jgi:hypothetical protein